MHRHPPMHRLTHSLAAAAAAVSFLAGCALKDAGKEPLSVAPVAPTTPSVTLPATPERLTGANAAERLVRNAVDLTEQKRFEEARRLLTRLRVAQPPHGVAWRAALCAEMVLALRQGDMAAFRTLGETLEPAWADPHRVDERCTGVVGLHRGLAGRALPLDTRPALERVVQRATLP